MKKLYIVLLIIMNLLISGCGPKKVAIQFSHKYCIGQRFSYIYRELTEAGFTNIQTTVIDDLTSESKWDDEYIESISVNGIDDFVSKDEFSPDSLIKITYHIIPKIVFPLSDNEINDLSSSAVFNTLQAAGYTNIYFDDIYDIDSDSPYKQIKQDITIDNYGGNFKGEEIPFDAKIRIRVHHPYEKYNVNIHIDFVPNLIFDRYDVDVLLDYNDGGHLVHGVDGSFTFKAGEGEHELKFYNHEDYNVKGSVILDVECDTDAAYKIYCYYDKIGVDTVYVDNAKELQENEIKMMTSQYSYIGENYRDVEKAFSDLGFTNIESKPVYDIYFGITPRESVSEVSIRGITSFTRGNIFNKDDEVIIIYHLNSDEDPEREVNDEDPEIEATEEVVNNNGNTNNSSNSDSSEKMTINQYVAYLDKFVKEYNSEHSTYTAKLWQGTVYINNITEGIKANELAVQAGDQGAIDSWNRLLESSKELSKSIKKDMDDKGLSKYHCTIYILDDTNTELVLASITDGKVIFDGANYIDNRDQ